MAWHGRGPGYLKIGRHGRTDGPGAGMGAAQLAPGTGFERCRCLNRFFKDSSGMFWR